MFDCENVGGVCCWKYYVSNEKELLRKKKHEN